MEKEQTADRLVYTTETASMDVVRHPLVGGRLDVARRVQRGLPETFGATPLSIDNPETSNQQINLFLDLQAEIQESAPSNVPELVTNTVEQLFAKRFYRRSDANHENFRDALIAELCFERDSSEYRLIQDAKAGRATPAELLLVREMMGISSIELACLTHPYGKKIDLLDPMRTAVETSVVAMGGEYCQSTDDSYRVKQLVGEKPEEASFDKGIFMIRKRTLGQMPDGTVIKERSSFIVRTDPESLVVREGLLSEHDLAMMKIVDPKSREWGDTLARIGGLDRAAEYLLDHDEFTEAIPISSTIYACNDETRQLVEARRDKHMQQSRQQNALIAPALYEEQQRLWGHTWTGSIQQIKPADSDR